jgi:hypothetical protein
MLNKFLLALMLGLFLTACGDNASTDTPEAELPPLTGEAPADEAAADEAPAEKAAE